MLLFRQTLDEFSEIQKLSRDVSASQQILLIPLCSGMQEGKVTEADRDPEEH